jgi:signal transduction histidine kinase/DNA-binding response OmpR family regulator
VAGERILLVEDAAEIRHAIANEVLRPAGYDVLTARDGAEGLTLARDLLPDLIIADYQMPHMDGLTMLEALRRDGLAFPFILITAEGSEMLAARALRLGVNDYLIKPFDAEFLIDSIRRTLRDYWVREIAEHTTDQLLQTNRQLEQRLRALERDTLHTILRDTEDVILVTDQQNHILFCNPAAGRVFEVDPTASVGRPLTEVIQNREVIELFEKEAPAQDRRRSEITLDQNRVLNAHLTVVQGVGCVAVMQDITHLKELDRIKSDFVTAVSHDLRSPLTAILGYVELLSRSGPLNDAQQKFAERIVFSVQSITALITDLLELGKIEAGFDESRTSIFLQDVVHHAIESQRHHLETKQHRLKVNITDDLLPVLGNPLRLRQLVINLLENAVKYTPDGGEVSVSLGAAGDFLLLCVADTGIGIPPKDLPYIFDKFYRSDEAIDNYTGTGLGLSIVKGIVERHQGRIWVESLIGKGSTFTVMLPSYNPDEPAS